MTEARKVLGNAIPGSVEYSLRAFGCAKSVSIEFVESSKAGDFFEAAKHMDFVYIDEDGEHEMTIRHDQSWRSRMIGMPWPMA